MASEFLTPQQYAETTGIPLSTVWRWLREGKLACLPRLPGARLYRIPATALEAQASQIKTAPTGRLLAFPRKQA